MGNLCMKDAQNAQPNSEENINAILNAHIAEVRSADELTVKMLLLGAGESGKSTLFKQMKINYVENYKKSDLLDEKDRIIKAFFMSFADLLAAIKSQHATIGSDDWDDMKEFLYGSDVKSNPVHPKNRQQVLNNEVVQFVKAVWNSEWARETWENRGNFPITDSLSYFIDSIDRLAAAAYEPTEEDYLRCRITSTGIVEQTFSYNNVKIVVVDVGGQRSERKKWIQCFDQVTAVLFVAAVSEFDQKLFEDGHVERFNEAKGLFGKTLKFLVFETTPFVLFLNKVDLLEEKLRKLRDKGENLDKYFPHLNLGTNYQGADKVILEDLRVQFEAMQAEGQAKRVFTHFTTALDGQAFKRVFQATAQVILSSALNAHFET